MPKKFTKEIVKKIIEQNKDNFLESDEYINCKTKLKIRCLNNHIFEMTFDDFKSGHRCPSCSGVKKHNIDFVKEYCINNDYICKSNEYINTKTKLELICSNGHNIRINFHNFQNGKRCPICSGKKKHNIDFVKEYSKKIKYSCLSDIYINAHEKLKFKCPFGHIFKMSFSNFKNLNQRCPDCYNLNRGGENHYNWNSDKTRTKRATYLNFDKRKKSILKEDPNYNDYLINKDKYHIDHIFPRIAFIDNDLDKKYNIKFIKEICNSVDNLQIILKEENLSKNKKYNQTEFMNWFGNKIKNYEENLKCA